MGIVDKGNTAIIAEKIAEKTGADVFEILAENPYPTGYEDCKTRATNERNDGVRPKYIGDVEDWSSYSLVFLGYPIWWGDMPMVVYSFLEDHDWTQKTVIPFNTHEGSGQSGTQTTIQDKCSNAEVLQGLAIRGSTAQGARKTEIQELSVWLKGLKLNENKEEK
ncbi:MAG: flavodoxin [Lachnospiraceae bacterium]|nr:flavodoxin [Lachnospiraceae bacterium]